MLVFEERRKAEYPEKKPLGANSTHIMASTPGFEPGPHWGEASALISAQFLALRSNGRKLVGQQSFEPTTSNISFVLWSRSVAQQCWIRLQTSSNINCAGATHADYTWTSKSYGLYPSHNALQVLTLLGVVESVCTPLATRRLKTPNIVDPVRLNIVLADNTNRVKEKFCTVMVVFVLVLYSPLDASGPWSIVGT